MSSEKLIEITTQLGNSYINAKDWDKKKTASRSDFFEEANKSFEVLAEKVVPVRANSLASAIGEAEKQFPAWTPLSATETEDGYDVHIKENPEYKPFTFVNPDDGMVYQKQVVSGKVLFDDERFKEDHPELYDVITYLPQPERELRPFEDLSDEQISLVQDYIYEGKPTIKLAAPRKTKEDEL